VIIRRVSLTALVVVTLVAGAMSSSASAAKVSPSDWAPSFCTAVTDWQTTVAGKSDELSSAVDEAVTAGQSPKAILTAARDQIASFLGDMVDATNDARSAIKDAGAPSSPNGAKISAVFVKGFKAIAQKFGDAQDEAKQLPTGSVQKFKVKSKELSVSLTEYGDTLSKDFGSIDKLDKGKQLEAAVKAAPECAALA
jgi:hypothetical protein